MFPCDKCNREKQCLDTFPIHNNKEESYFHLVNLDIQGPYQITASTEAPVFF